MAKEAGMPKSRALTLAWSLERTFLLSHSLTEGITRGRADVFYRAAEIFMTMDR